MGKAKMKFLKLLKVFIFSTGLQAETEYLAKIELERSQVALLWSNVTDSSSLCQGPECHTVNVKCSIPKNLVKAGQTPEFDFYYSWVKTIARNGRRIDGPDCQPYYMRQCENEVKSPIDINTCREYCFGPIIENSAKQTVEKTVQVQNYFSLKDDGLFTCVVRQGNTEIALSEEKKLLWIQPECGAVCWAGVVYSCLGGLIIILLIMRNFTFSNLPNKVDIAT